MVRELYKYMLKESSEPEKYSQLFRTKVPFRYDNFQCKFYDVNGNELKSDSITRGTKVIPLIKTTSMWFAGKGFGLTHQVEQMMVMDEETFDSCAIEVNGVVPTGTKRSSTDVHDGDDATATNGGKAARLSHGSSSSVPAAVTVGA